MNVSPGYEGEEGRGGGGGAGREYTVVQILADVLIIGLLQLHTDAPHVCMYTHTANLCVKL